MIFFQFDFWLFFMQKPFTATMSKILESAKRKIVFILNVLSETVNIFA